MTEEVIVQVKLASGQDVIGVQSEDSTDRVLALKFPMEIKSTIDMETGVTGWVLGKFLTFSGEVQVLFNRSQIIASAEVYNDFKDYYIYSAMYYAKVEESKFLNDIKSAVKGLTKKYRMSLDPVQINLIATDKDISQYPTTSSKIH